MKKPKPLGKVLRFEVTLTDGELLMGGAGCVIEAHEDTTNRFRKPGVRIRIDEIDDAGREWLARFRAAAAEPARAATPTDAVPVAVKADVSEGWDLGRSLPLPLSMSPKAPAPAVAPVVATAPVIAPVPVVAAIAAAPVIAPAAPVPVIAPSEPAVVAA